LAPQVLGDFQSGALRSATAPPSITVGQPLTLTVTVENTSQPFLGNHPPSWYFAGQYPSWIASVERVSWDTNAPSSDFYNYDWVFPDAQSTFVFSLSEAKLPTTPGNYAVLLNCFYPYENDGFVVETYLRMDGSPVVVPFSIVNGAPGILAQPQSQRVAVGTDVAFSVKASGTLLMNYQWRFNGMPLPGATNATLALSSVTTNVAGDYTVKVSNNLGQAVSDPATLIIDVPPAIVNLPHPQIASLGDRVTFDVMALGSEPLNYQWHLNGADISGATNASLTILSVQSADAGGYSVTVSNNASTLTTPPVALTIRARLTAILPLSDSPFQLSLLGGQGQIYRVETSTNLIDWTQAMTVTNIGETLPIPDPTATNLTHRFYRAISE
jgi:hypothetical protein